MSKVLECRDALGNAPLTLALFKGIEVAPGDKFVVQAPLCVGPQMKGGEVGLGDGLVTST